VSVSVVTGPRLPLVLTAFGLPHVMGYLPTRSGQKPNPPLTPFGLMDAAVELGLAGVEAPLPAPGAAVIDAWRSALRERDLDYVADLTGSLDADPESIRAQLEVASELGARVVRATLSTLLCGDRRPLAGGWEAHLERRALRLREVLPRAEELGICLALENHQDATSHDLVRLAEMVGHSPAYGVTLDTGNALAVAEDPVEFARRVAPLVRHVHLKDYTLHLAPEGFRLVRCAAGDGVIDFPAILAVLRERGRELSAGLEIAAQATRTIELSRPDWWACYPREQALHLPPVLALIWGQARPQHEPYASAWERGEDSASVSAEEWSRVRGSVVYFGKLGTAALSALSARS
jgi:sugar phosphate isomerase/epimerase